VNLLSVTRGLLLIAFLSMLASHVLAQRLGDLLKKDFLSNPELDKQDILTDIIRHDLAVLFTETPAAQIFGFIGEDYQRIHIKFISVIRNHSNPSEYFLYGKSMVKNNVCDFQGTLTMTNAYRWRQSDVPDFQQGIVMGTYRFFENPRQKHVGIFGGTFVSSWYLDKGGELHYDDLAAAADGYSNNQFAGTWRNYSGTIMKPCHWGDNRIPLADDFDGGTGEFFPNEKYHANGWKSYVEAYGGSHPNAAAARARENRQWWKD
jgi:hypothetical protein